jgi:hypothetical protein
MLKLVRLECGTTECLSHCDQAALEIVSLVIKLNYFFCSTLNSHVCAKGHLKALP